MAIRSKVDRVRERYKKLCSEKEMWKPQWQRISEYVMYKKHSFTSEPMQGQFLNEKISDSTAPKALEAAVAAIWGALWPNGERTFQFEPPDNMPKQAAEDPTVVQWYRDITKAAARAVGHYRSGFNVQGPEALREAIGFGTAGMAVLENYEDDDQPISFTCISVKNMAIAANCYGIVDTEYIDKCFTVRELIEEYGEGAVSGPVAQKIASGNLDDKIKVIQGIEPRIDGIPGSFGNQSMPWADLHYEHQTGKILREQGYHENPIKVFRFWKHEGEVYGRCPSFNAIPDILEINALRDAVIIATEKLLDPPVAVYDDGSVGNSEIDTSANAINVFRVSGRLQNQTYIEPINLVGELNSTFKRITELEQIIDRHYFNDRLMDFNNEQRMTLGEAQMRYEFRGTSLNPIYSRCIEEFFTPILERVFNILYNRGIFGITADVAAGMAAMGIKPPEMVIPDAVLDLIQAGHEAYKITFISPAVRQMRLEERTGLQSTVSFAGEMAKVAPEILDIIDFDEVMRKMQDLTGAPASILRSGMEVKQIRQSRQQAQQAQMELEMRKANAEISKDETQAAHSQAKATGLVK